MCRAGGGEGWLCAQAGPRALSWQAESKPGSSHGRTVRGVLASGSGNEQEMDTQSLDQSPSRDPGNCSSRLSRVCEWVGTGAAEGGQHTRGWIWS